MTTGGKVALWGALYLAAGGVYALINNAAIKRSQTGLPPAAFFGYTGNEGPVAFYAEAIGTWPAALVYGLVRGDPLELPDD